MIKKCVVFVILMGLMATPVMMAKNDKSSRKKKQYEERTPVMVEQPKEEQGVQISDAAAQLRGEWNVVELKGEEVSLSRANRPFLNFDIVGGTLYGNTGINVLNAKVEIKDEKVRFSDIIKSSKQGSYPQEQVEKDLIQALKDASVISLSKVGAIEYMELKKDKKNVLVKLRRQNLDFINGPWMVKMINGVNVSDRHIKLVNDVEMLTVHIDSGCNIVSGVISIDPTKEFGVEYEDLLSPQSQCPNIDTETRLLIALEETLYCRTSADNPNEVELFMRETDETGNKADKVLVVLQKASFN